MNPDLFSCVVFTAVVWPKTTSDHIILLTIMSHAENGANEFKIIETTILGTARKKELRIETSGKWARGQSCIH